MNNKVMWVVGIIIIAAIALYLIMAKSKTGNEAAVNTAGNSAVKTGQNAATPATKASSLKDLLALGTSQKCTYSDNGSQGTFYVSGGKSRGDFTSTVAGKSTGGHMIADGKTSYVWMDGEKQGFKMSLDASAQQQANAPASQSQGVDVNKQMDYSCQAWSADNSMFTMPSGIEFVDLAEMMKNSVPNIPVPKPQY